MTFYLRFNTANQIINKRIFSYNGSCLVEDMLKNFLLTTNSILTLNANDISFLWKAELINKDKNLKKTVKSFFKNIHEPIIQVIDTSHIIGGEKDIGINNS